MRIVSLVLIVLITGYSQVGVSSEDHYFEYLGSKPRYLFLPNLNNRVWENNTIQWWYNPAGQPFGTDEAVQAIHNAANAWSNISGVRFQYMGTTTQALSNQLDDQFVIGWLDGFTFAVRFGNYKAYTYIWWYSNIVDGELSLNLDEWQNASLSDFQGIVTHELGHAIGLDHSDIYESIMYVPYHTLEYQKTLRADDIMAAQALYGLADYQRVMNWAENVIPELFLAGGRQELEVPPFQVRYYPGSNTYLGFNPEDSRFYGYNPALWGESIVPFGTLSEYWPSAEQAGF